MACIPSLEGCDTGVVFILALDNRFALGTVYLGGATSTYSCRYAHRGGLYGVSKTIVCREGEKGVWGVMEFNRVRRAEHAGSYMARGLRRRLPLRHVSHKEGKESTKGVSGKREPRPVK